MKMLTAALAAACLALSVPAMAAPITETISFTANFPAGSPFMTVTGSGTVTFDPTVDHFASPFSGSWSLPAQYTPLQYVYNASLTSLFIGNNCVTNYCSVTSNVDEAYIAIPINTATGLPVGDIVFPYSVGANNQIYFTTTGSASGIPTGVPEPISLAMFGVGLLGLGMIRRVA